MEEVIECCPECASENEGFADLNSKMPTIDCKVCGYKGMLICSECTHENCGEPEESCFRRRDW